MQDFEFEKKFSYSQQILVLLANAEEQCMTSDEIASKINIDKRYLYVVLSRLENKGVIFSRWISENERRKIYCLNYFK